MSTRSKDKILIVDDEPMIRWALREALREWGYEPIEASTSVAALAAWAAASPVAVLLDINLPDGSGLDVLREIKRRQPQAIVIMITADVLVENAISALRGGADDFVGKPLNLDELQFILQDTIKARQPPQEMANKPRLLMVNDAVDRLTKLKALLDSVEVEITSVTSTDQLSRACGGKHDLAVVDVSPAEIVGVLKALRESAGHAEIPILVDASRLANEPSVTGVLSIYRAMPCSQSELVTLARRRLASITGRWQAKKML